MSVRRVIMVIVVLCVLMGALAPTAHARQLRAGAAAVDATWHVGASAGQYASTRADSPEQEAEFDPSVQSFKNKPSYGVQSRLQVRAFAVQEQGGKTFAVAKTDLYIPQDLLWRRAAQLLEAETGGVIGLQNLTMAITHDHSAPYYASTAAGAWAFQDVFDVRFYDYYARKIADAVELALKGMKPARMGASVTTLDEIQQNVPGPSIANNGTPAGYPRSYGDHDVSVVRFDTLGGAPIGQIVTYSLHPETLDGNDLISADLVGPFQRMLDRETGGVTVFMQSAVGNSETEENTYHDPHKRLWFEHKQYGQNEYAARLLADAAASTWRRIAKGTPDPSPRNAPHFVRMRGDVPVGSMDRWFPGPVSHPYPTVGNCRTDTALGGNPQAPAVGLPDCQGPPAPPFSPPFSPGLTAAKLAGQGIPVPSNYGAPSYGALEESLGIHLQALRLGPVLLTMCSCEQWADQSENIRTRTDATPGNEWLGYDWADPDRPGNDGSPGCERETRGTWSCPDPRTACTVDAHGVRFCRDPVHPNTRITGIDDHDFQVMRAQVLNPADGWDDPACTKAGCGLQAESEPDDPAKIFGAYTHDDTDVRSPGHAQSSDFARRYGYTLTIPVGMANDYNGYIATYREYQRGDHYRKALTGWGPHSSDYMATHLVEMGRALNGHQPSQDAIDRQTDPAKGDPVYAPLAAKQAADRAHNDARAQALGTAGGQAAKAYQASLPDNGGKAGPVEQPKDVQRFGAAFFAWIGGDNYTDMPVAVVQRRDSTGHWEDYADGSGEVPITLKLPKVSADAPPAYLNGGQEWRWTATFEAFVSRYDLGDRPRATPAGIYRFAVSGRRQKGGAQVPYRFTSEPFAVRPWDGLRVTDMRRESDGTVSFAPGPVDYPDSYEQAAKAHGVRFIKEERSFVRDPAAPDDPSRFEWYCLACSFRPWLDTGSAAQATVTFTRHGHDVRAAATPVPGSPRWRTTRTLRPGEIAFVDRGDLQDRYANHNATRSTEVTG